MHDCEKEQRLAASVLQAWPQSPRHFSDEELETPQSLHITLFLESLRHEKSEIRILTLLPADDPAEPIRCHLRRLSAFTTDMPPYTALSYCWGSPYVLVPIIVNNHTHYVTQNLEAALRVLRNQGYSDLWVDALCINQHDGQEKGHQIHRMRDIYRYAKSTVAWLAPDDLGVGEKTFTALANTSAASPSDGVSATKPSWSDVEQLVALPYWHRAWIIQELALSPSVIVAWGQSTIPLLTLRSILLTIWADRPSGALVDPKYRNYVSMLNLMYILDKVQRPMDLISALRYSCTALSTVERDKVFGVLGLCKNASLIIPAPDYKAALGTVITEMNRNILLYETKKPGDLDVLCLGNPRTPKEPGQPSWSIYWPSIWRDSNPRAWTSRADRGLKAGYLACGRSVAEPLLSNWPSDSGDGEVLTCQGRIFDTVASLSGDEIHPPIEGEISSPEKVYGSVEALFEAIWRSVMMNRLKRDATPRPPVHLGLEFAKLWSSTCVSVPADDPALEPTVLQYTVELGRLSIGSCTVQEWARKALDSQGTELKEKESDIVEASLEENLSFGRRLMTTKKGYVGVAHYQSKPGDLVCLLAGCTMPMIVRKVGDGYEFVGEAYVHGIMDGEVWESQTNDGPLLELRIV